MQREAAKNGTAKTWKDFLPAARRRLEEAKDQYGDFGARLEDDPTKGSGDDDRSRESDSVDLQNPQVQAAIRAAVQRERQAAQEREAGLKENRDDLLKEKKKWSELGDPDQIAKRLERLEKLENDRAANDVGVDSEKFQAKVDEVAQKKYEARAKELRDVMESKDEEIAKLKAAREDAEKAAHRRFVEANLVRAAMPEDTKIVHDGAWKFLLDTLEDVVVEHEVDGLGKVPRLKINGALHPGNGKDGLMDLRELYDLARQGKGPVEGLDFVFVSNGKGSGTHSTDNSKPTSGGNWWKMSDSEQTAYVNEHGAAAAQELMDESPRPEAAEK